MERLVLLIALFAVTAGCGGGGGSTPSGPLHVEYRISASTSPAYPNPLALGDHVVIAVSEKRCSGHLNQYGQAGVLTCDPSTAPRSLVAVVGVLLDGAPCGLTVAVLSPSQLDVTKTGPGDPSYSYAGKTGWCDIRLSDPTTGAIGTATL